MPLSVVSEVSRIVCIGNRYVAADDFGPRVFDALSAMDLPAGVDIVDGGLAGLNLLGLLDDECDVLFVDNVSGYAVPGELTVIDGAELARQCAGDFGHQAGLPFLVQILPAVVARPPRRIRLLGCEGPATPALAARAAMLGLQLVVEGT